MIEGYFVFLFMTFGKVASRSLGKIPYLNPCVCQIWWKFISIVRTQNVCRHDYVEIILLL